MNITIPSIRRLAVIGLVAGLFIPACGPGADPDLRTDGVTPAGGPVAAGPSAAGTSGGDASVDATLIAEGKAGWRSCAKCHCTTDPGIEGDADWIRMNEETTCIAAGAPAPRLRSAIIAFLHDPDTLRPILVDESFRPEPGAKTGQLLVPSAAGSAYLRADRDSIRDGAPAKVRLHWKKTDGEKSMVVPAGYFDVVNFWFYRPAAGGGEDRWMVTGTNVNGCTSLTIDPGEEELLDVEPLLLGEFTAQRKEGRYALSFSMHDAGGTRMTLSKNGRVVMPEFLILDADGNTVARDRFGII